MGLSIRVLLKGQERTPLHVTCRFSTRTLKLKRRLVWQLRLLTEMLEAVAK